MSNSNELTQERLKQLLNYNPETGIFTSRVTRGRAKIGAIAGSPNSDGYINIMVDYILYKAHRLAWLYTHGVWPTHDIDHGNGIRDDNRISNLSDKTRSENGQNQKMHREGHLVGTAFDKRRGRWMSKMYVKGKCKFLGYFDTQIEAHVHHWIARSSLMD